MALEKNDGAAVAFADSWKSIALRLQSYPPQQLSFNLLNEPEFENPKPNSSKRDKWLSIAKKTVSGIRSVSPDRTVILEGIGKSLFARRKNDGAYKYSSPDELLKPIDLDNIIYAFHNYEPEEFLQQAKYRHGSYGREYSKKYSKMFPKGSKMYPKCTQNHSKVDLRRKSWTLRKHRYLQCSRHFGTSKMPSRGLKMTLKTHSKFRPQT